MVVDVAHATSKAWLVLQGVARHSRRSTLCVVRALLAHEANKILVVCYTNHALDQILEAILDSRLPESKILQIGGQRCATYL